MDLLVRARVGMILANSTLLIICVALGWRLLGLWPALVGGLLLALEPFLVAHSQVVHVDGLIGRLHERGDAGGRASSGGCGGSWGYLVLCGARERAWPCSPRRHRCSSGC